MEMRHQGVSAQLLARGLRRDAIEGLLLDAVFQAHAPGGPGIASYPLLIFQDAARDVLDKKGG